MNPRRDHRFWIHRKHFSEHCFGEGLEIGAFDLPLVESEEGICEFADFRSTKELRELAENLPGHNPSFVVDVKYDLKLGYSQISRKYNWIAAAHTIEHVPDVIGWLKVIDLILCEGGAVFLIVPDGRFTFDRYRAPTTISDMIECHHLKIEKPSFRQVFDHIYNAIPPTNPGLFWSGAEIPIPRYDFNIAMDLALRSEREYFDVHCSVFTPESFFRIFSQLANAGVIPFRVTHLRPTEANQMDFSVVLHRT